jgi:hypothetical protein
MTLRVDDVFLIALFDSPADDRLSQVEIRPAVRVDRHLQRHGAAVVALLEFRLRDLAGAVQEVDALVTRVIRVARTRSGDHLCERERPGAGVVLQSEPEQRKAVERHRLRDVEPVVVLLRPD